MPALILENIRSSYNVGNIIRTADAFNFDIIISWYTPSPKNKTSICKTSLWAEKNVKIYEFYNTKKAILFAKEKYKYLIASEINKSAKSLNNFDIKNKNDLAIVLWNEVNWVLQETLSFVDEIIYIPMFWIKESLNVWQASSILMWEYYKKYL